MVVETPTSAFTRQKFYEDRILRPPMRNARKGDCASPEVEAKWDNQFPIPAQLGSFHLFFLPTGPRIELKDGQ